MKRVTYLRIGVLALLIIFAATLFIVMWSHPTAHQAMHHPRQMHALVHDFVRRHRVIAPLVFILLNVLLVLAMLPVWWLGVLGGVAFGLIPGIIFGQLAATLSATLTVLLAHWLAGEWIHKKIEGKRERLRHIDEMLGNNGALVVMAVRLTHLVPFALSNYFFGLTRISAKDAMVGTFVGGIPTTAIYVTLGANRSLLKTWHFWVILIGVNLLLLVPLLLRWWYRRKHPPVSGG